MSTSTKGSTMADRVKQIAKQVLPSGLKTKLFLMAKRYPSVRKLVRSDLVALAKLHGTDKWGTHQYALHYQSHFRSLQYRRLNILEIGVGGADNPQAGGNSLRMWKDYFPNANIYGIDIYDKS